MKRRCGVPEIRWVLVGPAAWPPAAAHALETSAWQGHDVFAIALGAGIFVLGIGLVLAILRETNPGTQPAAGSARSLTAPPELLQPALAGALTAGDARLVHEIACVFDLVQRGCLQFEVTDADKPQVAGAWQLRRPRTAVALEPWERSVLESMCPRPGDAVAAPAAWRALRANWSRFRDGLRAELQRSGDLDPDAAERRRGLYAMSGVCALLGAGGIVAAGGLVNLVGPAGFVPGVAMLVVAAVALAGTVSMTRLSPRGRRRGADWQAFASFLRSCVGRGASLDAAAFGRDFTYAIAFGLAPAWLRAAKRASLAAPVWFGGDRTAAAPLAALEAQLVASGGYASAHRTSHAVSAAG